jgi:hypothetical protein
MAGGRKKRTDATPTRVSAQQKKQRPNLHADDSTTAGAAGRTAVARTKLHSIAETDADDSTTASAAGTAVTRTNTNTNITVSSGSATKSATAAAATAATTTADRTVRKTDGSTAATTTNLHPLSPPVLKLLATKYKNSPSSEAFDIATGFRLYTKIISQTTNTTTTTSNTNTTTTDPTLDDGGGETRGGNNVNGACDDVGRDKSGGGK